MKHVLTLIISMAVLTACGVDGEPVQPTVSGAVTISDSGIYPSVGVGLYQSPFSVFLGLGR